MKPLGAAILVGVIALQSQAPAPAPRRPVPAAANSIAAAPESLYGQVVSVTASVDRLLSPSVFVVDHDRTRSVEREVLVVAPILNAPVAANARVTIVGELLPFDPAEIARRAGGYKVDLAADVRARYQGRPAILATAVVTAGFADLARRLPRPMTPEEESFDKVMKRIGPAFNSLRTAAGTSNAAGAAENTKVLKAAFLEVESFWKARGTADALEWTRTARRQLEAVERAAATGAWDQVKTSMAGLNQSCQTCHAAYRERLDDGTFQLLLRFRE